MEGRRMTKKGKSAVEQQADKIFRHTRANSYGTRAEYRGKCSQFCRFISDKFKLQNLKNLDNKHIAAYIKYRQELGIAPKTIKNDLAAIRYMHDQIPNAKTELFDNQKLSKEFGLVLEKTPQVKGNRAWTDTEYKDFIEFATKNGRQDVVDIAKLCRHQGLRITEAVAMSRSQAEQALRTGIYQVKGEAKGGKWRQVPLSDEAREVLKERLKSTPRGERLFVKEGEKTHLVVGRYEKYLKNNRDKIETTEGKELRTWEKYGKTNQNELTWHGLRYCYVQERVDEEVAKGYELDQACYNVTKEIGHERIDVIDIYLGK